MLRKISAFLTLVLAMLLSVVLAVPAHADASSDFWTNLANQQKPGGTYQYKYGFDYYKAEWKPTATGQTALNSLKTPTVVSPTVHPSSTGASWYLDQWRNRGTVPGTPVLTGKIIEPGKTLVRTPSSYAPVAKFVGSQLGFGRLLGTLGAGMGGTSLAPANSAQLALSQGVSAGCVDGTSACSSDEIAKRFAIDSCGIKGTCEAIGAVGSQGETDAQKWFRESVLAPIDDLWAGLTGQKNDMTPSDVHVELANPKGCRKEVGFQLTGHQLGTAFYRGVIINARPTSVAPRASWDAGCSDLSKLQNANIKYTTECIDPATGLMANASNGSLYGIESTLAASTDPATGVFQSGKLCSSGSSVPATVVPFKIRFWNPITETAYVSSTNYGVATYSEWLNPDPGLNGIENLEIETKWDCATGDGVTYSFTQTTKKTAAIVSPECPPGSTLQKHEIKAKTPGGTETIDAGAAVPGAAAQYPDCAKSGCSVQVFLDGTACTAVRTECHTWPAITARQPSRIVCKWGSYTVQTSDCNVLSNAYKTETGVVYDPHSGTWVAIDTYGNPVDANPEPWNPTNPNPVPGATPGTPPTTGTGTPTSTFPTTGVSPADGCVAPVWSWNPRDWVKNPVVCALQDALVPKTDIQARMEGFRGVIVNTAPVSWINPVIAGPGGAGCPNWNVVIPGVMSKNVVCDSSFTAALVGVRGPMFGLITAAMVWPLLRSIWYAAIPVLRVTPTSSK